MRTETKLFMGLAVFLLPLAVLYWFTSYEEAGSLMLILTVVAFAFIGTYMGIQSRRLGGLRPEDYDAIPSEGAGEVGSFPVGSIWPLMGALGATLMGFGMVFTSFLAIPGLGLIVITVIGFARESAVAEIGHLDFNSHTNPDAAPIEGHFSDQVKK